jgi:hypothetical protein
VHAGVGPSQRGRWRSVRRSVGRASGSIQRREPVRAGVGLSQHRCRVSLVSPTPWQGGDPAQRPGPERRRASPSPLPPPFPSLSLLPSTCAVRAEKSLGGVGQGLEGVGAVSGACASGAGLSQLGRRGSVLGCRAQGGVGGLCARCRGLGEAGGLLSVRPVGEREGVGRGARVS